jgi:hypothetical protein
MLILSFLNETHIAYNGISPVVPSDFNGFLPIDITKDPGKNSKLIWVPFEIRWSYKVFNIETSKRPL